MVNSMVFPLCIYNCALNLFSTFSGVSRNLSIATSLRPMCTEKESYFCTCVQLSHAMVGQCSWLYDSGEQHTIFAAMVAPLMSKEMYPYTFDQI